MKDLIAQTRGLFEEGLPLAKMVEGKLAIDLEMFSRGGMAVLDAIEEMGYDTLHERPSVSKGKQVRLLGRAVVTHVLGGSERFLQPDREIRPLADALRVAQSPTRNATGLRAKHTAIFIRRFFCCRKPSATELWRCMHSCG